MDLNIHATPNEVADTAALRILDLIAGSQGQFSLGLAGGSTPAATYSRLRETDVDWSGVNAWLADERWVPPDHDRCNGRMAAETLTDHIDATLHRPIWSEDARPEDVAAEYETTIRSISPSGHPDLVLLGMGDDGHTASLFPGTEALEEDKRWVVANHVPQIDEVRITATYPLLWASDHVIFLVTGRGKATALKDTFSGDTPAGHVGRGEGKVEWHVDTAAASLLS